MLPAQIRQLKDEEMEHFKDVEEAIEADRVRKLDLEHKVSGAGFGVSQRKWIECEKFSLSQRNYYPGNY